MRTITRRLNYFFSKNQNFFEMNPIYPDSGQKDFDIYNAGRKKINILDLLYEYEQRDAVLQKRLQKEILSKRYEKKVHKQRKGLVIDKQTNLPVDLHPDLENFFKQLTIKQAIDHNIKGRFRRTLSQFIRKLEGRSQADLIRLYRISLAHIKNNKDKKKQLSGQLVQRAVLETVRYKSYEESRFQNEENNDPQELQQEEFQKIIKDIDNRIEAAEKFLRVGPTGLPNKLSDYHPKYGWKMERKSEMDEEYDLFLDKNKPAFKITDDSRPNSKNFQISSIKSRINRLYFLRRLQFQKKEQKNMLALEQQLPINVIKTEAYINKLANRYKEAELTIEPSMQELYKEVDIALDRIHVKINPSMESEVPTEGCDVVARRDDPAAFLWQNLDVEEVLCGGLYSDAENVPVPEKTALEVSPSPHTELTLNKLPINLHRHTELEIFNVFHDFKHKVYRENIYSTEIDHQPRFKYFDLEEATHREKRKRQKYTKFQTATGYGKRKTAEAEALVKPGTGKVFINGIPLEDYYAETYHRAEALKPLLYTGTAGKLDVQIRAAGSGAHGQSQCIAYALAQALLKANPDCEDILDGFGLLGQDRRRSQRKRTNLYSARVRPPYVRR